MSSALAAVYAYRALNDRETARVFRSFGYFASADHVERRAERFEAMAEREAKTTGAATFDGAAPAAFPLPMIHATSDLHTTSDGYEQTGLFAEQEPPA